MARTTPAAAAAARSRCVATAGDFQYAFTDCHNGSVSVPAKYLPTTSLYSAKPVAAKPRSTIRRRKILRAEETFAIL
jgi:hypothetical protein